MANGTLKVSNIETSSGSGTITIGQSGETVNIPSGATVSGAVANTPAFSVTNSADQSIPHDTNTKITFDTEIFDTDSAFASNKFVVPVAGKYLINAMVRIESSTDAPIEIKFYKNGSSYKKRRIGQQLDYDTISFTDIDTYAVNDYLEVYYLQGTGGSVNISGGTTDEFRAIFQGYRLIGV